MTPQPMLALRRANEVRWEQARIAREIRALPHHEGRRRVAELLTHPPEAVARMKVGYLLRAVKRQGPAIARKRLAQAGLSAATWERRIGPLPNFDDKRAVAPLPLTARQREALARELLA